MDPVPGPFSADMTNWPSALGALIGAIGAIAGGFGGYQARVGINAVVGGPVEPRALGEGLLGESAALFGMPAARLGEETRVGITARTG